MPKQGDLPGGQSGPKAGEQWAQSDLESGAVATPQVPQVSDNGGSGPTPGQPTDRTTSGPGADEKDMRPGEAQAQTVLLECATAGAESGPPAGYRSRASAERASEHLPSEQPSAAQGYRLASVSSASASKNEPGSGRPASLERFQRNQESRHSRSSNSDTAADAAGARKSAEKRSSTAPTTTAAPSANPAETFNLQQLLQYQASRNVGSRARDLLALERTFLSMIRTSLSSVALGVAIAKLIGTRLADAAGTVFISLGLLTLLIGLWRYYSQILAIERGQFAADTVFPWVVVLLLLTSGVISLVLIFK
jgi:uncharacterized membrane protein YidH (DUF202 family)